MRSLENMSTGEKLNELGLFRLQYIKIHTGSS